jgi:hypothetical protein
MSLRDDTATIPTTIWMKKNSTGAGTTMDVIRMVVKCRKRAVRESKKTRVKIGTHAIGRIYTVRLNRSARHAKPMTINIWRQKKSIVVVERRYAMRKT